jgi:uncharacterized protein
LAEEIAEVLRRPKLMDRYGITDQDVQDVLVLLAPFLPSVETEAPVRDPDDRPVVSTALTARAEMIVTGDKDLAEARTLGKWLAQRGIVVLTPAELLDQLGR